MDTDGGLVGGVPGSGFAGGLYREEFGDAWAWDAWEVEGQEDVEALAGIMEVAATCFVGLDRWVGTVAFGNGVRGKVVGRGCLHIIPGFPQTNASALFYLELKSGASVDCLVGLSTTPACQPSFSDVSQRHRKGSASLDSLNDISLWSIYERKTLPPPLPPE